MGRKLCAAICGVIMAMAMTFSSFAGVYGNTNQECFYNQEWRIAFTNCVNTDLTENKQIPPTIFWVENEADRSNDKVVVVWYDPNHMDLNMHHAMVCNPNGDVYYTAYRYSDGTYHDEDQWTSYTRYPWHMDDYNEFSAYAPQ